jgi:hypothetical protein
MTAEKDSTSLSSRVAWSSQAPPSACGLPRPSAPRSATAAGAGGAGGGSSTTVSTPASKPAASTSGAGRGPPPLSGARSAAESGKGPSEEEPGSRPAKCRT